jgi:hypothetical protein
MHVAPVKPPVQLQVYEPPFGTHVPLFRHGFEAHGPVVGVEHVSPV